MDQKFHYSGDGRKAIVKKCCQLADVVLLSLKRDTSIRPLKDDALTLDNLYFWVKYKQDLDNNMAQTMYMWLFPQNTCLHLSVIKKTQKVMNAFYLFIFFF